MYHRVLLTAKAVVSTNITVLATGPEEAMKLAIKQAKEGNVVWNYDGAEDETIMAVDSTAMGSNG